MTSFSYRLIAPLVILLAFLAISASSFAQAREETDTVIQTTATPPQASRGELTDRINQRRTQTQQQRATAKERFAESMTLINDQAKRTVVERINNTLETINQNKTSAWANAIDRLTAVLDRIEVTIGEFSQSGADTAEIEDLADSARASLAIASAAVEAQAEKAYIIEITDEATLRESIQPVVQQFKDDLRTTLSSVVEARDLVRQAARGLATLNTPQEEPQTLDLQPESGSDIIE